MSYADAWKVVDEEGAKHRAHEIANFVIIVLSERPSPVLGTLLQLHMKHDAVATRRVGMMLALICAEDRPNAAMRLAQYYSFAHSYPDNDFLYDILAVVEWWIRFLLERRTSWHIQTLATLLTLLYGGADPDWTRRIVFPDDKSFGGVILRRALASIEDAPKALEPLIVQLKLKKTVAAKWRSALLPKVAPADPCRV